MARQHLRIGTGRGVGRLVGALGLICALMLAAGPSRAQEFVMKFATQTRNDVHQEFMTQFKAELEKVTNKRIRVDVYTAAQLGSAPRQIEGVRLGTIEGMAAPAELLAGADPRFPVLTMPGLFKGAEHALHTVDVPEIRQAIAEIATSRRMVLIGLTFYGSQLFAFKKPVTKLEDLSGKRIRIVASEGEQDVLRALGASPIPMALPEVLPAIQQGILDGASSAFPVYVGFKFYDSAPNILDTDLWQVISLNLVSKAWFDRLPPDLQKAVMDTGAKVEIEVNKWALAKVKSYAAIWTSNGGKIVKLSPAEQADLVRRATAAIQPLLKKNPQLNELYNKVKAAAATVN